MKIFYRKMKNAFALMALLLAGSDLKAQCPVTISQNPSGVICIPNPTLTAVYNNIDQNQAANNTCMATFGQSNLAQSFVPTTNFMGGAGIYISTGGTGNVTISLWTNLPNNSGVMIASGTVAASSGAWADVTWSPVSVTPGVTYYLVFTGSNTSMCIAGSTSNPYANGMVYANSGYGPFPGYDYTFRTYGNTGAASFLWSNGATTSSILPTVSGTYNLTLTIGSCTSTASHNLVINTPPVVTASPSSSTICNGQSAVLNGGGASTYTWTGGVTNGVAFSPSSSGSYTVTGTAASGCTNSAVATINVNNCTPAAALNFDGIDDNVNIGTSMNSVLDPLNKITVEAWVNPSNTTGLGVISGNYGTPNNSQMQFLLRRDADQYTMWVDAGAGYQVVNSGVATVTTGIWQHVAGVWDGSKLQIFINGVLKATTNGVTGTSFASSSNSVKIGFNDINERFTGSIDEVRIWTLARTQCEINTFKNCEIATTATGLLANYHFNQGFSGVANTVTTLTNAASASYNGTLSNFALTGSTSNWIAPGGVVSGSVTPASLAPVVTASATSSVICNGASTTLNGGGATTYTWTGGVTNGVSFSPINTATYTVIGTNAANGCTNSAVQAVTVNPLPVVTANATSSVICNGASTTLNGGGATTYTWTGGVTNGVSFSPVNTATYTVIGTNAANGCTNSAVQAVTVNPLPVVTANATSSVICNGQLTTLNGGGASTYTWSGGVTNGVAFSPANTTTYTVSGTNTLTGCTSTNNAAVTITVNALPVVTASVSNAVICEGASTTLNGGGADTYTWTGGVNDGVSFSPLTTDSYTVTGTNTLTGCSNTAVETVTVNTLPVVSASITNSVICEGASVTVNGSGADTYTWTNGVIDGAAFTPTVTGSYTVTGTNTLTGCTSTNVAVASVTVNANPIITAASGAICTGGSYTIMPSGASTYTISGGAAIVSPSVTTSYSISGTSTEGCIGNTAVVTVSVQSSLTVSIAGSTTVCDGNSVSLTANGATSYTWNTGVSGNAIAPSPSVNTTYSVVGSSGLCSDSATIFVTVNANPTVSAVSNSSLLCVGQTVTLSASGAVSYTWSNNATGANVTDSPTITTTYTVTGQDANGCSDTAVVVQNVSQCTDLQVYNSLLQFEMYPNPTSGRLHIVLNADAQISITNSIGEILSSGKMTEGNNQIDIREFANGIYFVHVIQNGNQKAFKLIKH